jgi:hypothetical protein
VPAETPDRTTEQLEEVAQVGHRNGSSSWELGTVPNGQPVRYSSS